MIGYTTLGTNNFEKSLEFYDTVLPEAGGKRVFELPNGQLYGFAQGPMFGVLTPENGQSATNGNGTMIALNVGSQDKVQALYNKAIECGAQDEGSPGPRGDSGFYGAYFRDPDGNKLCAFCMG